MYNILRSIFSGTFRDFFVFAEKLFFPFLVNGGFVLEKSFQYVFDTGQ